MKKFLLTSPKFEGQVTFGYDQEGSLIFYNNEVASSAVVLWLKRFLPLEESLLSEIQKKISGTIQEIPEDLSFERFWKAYRKKINRKRAEPLWNKLTDANKMLALMRVNDYLEACFRLKRGVVDPERYIKDLYFETDWKKEK